MSEEPDEGGLAAKLVGNAAMAAPATMKTQIGKPPRKAAAG
jgi:hypothetical protein